jgi:hypothetical protein
LADREFSSPRRFVDPEKKYSETFFQDATLQCSHPDQSWLD